MQRSQQVQHNKEPPLAEPIMHIMPGKLICNEWSECASGLQARYCTDQNGCGTAINKPYQVQNCEEKPSEIEIPQLIETQFAPKPEFIALTIAMLFGLIGVLGLRSRRISRTMKKVLELAHIVLVLSIIGLLVMTFAEQPATDLISAVGQTVAANWAIAATLIGIVIIIGAELALRGFKLSKLKLPKFRLLKKKLAKKLKAKPPEESEQWKQRQKHAELLTRVQSFEHALDTRLARYGSMLESLHHATKHVTKEYRKLKREGEELKRIPAYIAREEKSAIAFAHSIQLPKLTTYGKRTLASAREALLHAVPKFSIPKIKLPSIKINVPKLAFPRLNIPKISIPKLTLPKLVMPKLAVPKLNIPKFAIPKIRLPSLKVPKITIAKHPIAQPQEVLPMKSSFTIGKEVSKSIPQVLDLNPEELEIKQRTVMDKRHRAAIAHMRAQFGLPVRISAHKHRHVSGFVRHQL
jgi:hypothetical protein